MKDKILFVGGTFDERGGEESKIVSEFSKYLDNVDLYNGGYYEDLNKIYKECRKKIILGKKYRVNANIYDEDTLIFEKILDDITVQT